MFRFESPTYLYLLLVIPLVVALFIFNIRRKRRVLQKLGRWENVKPMIGEVSKKKIWTKFSLMLIALTLLIFAIARPQVGTRLKTDVVSGIEVVVAMDVSNSMMAQDVDPTRLDKAKQVVATLCRKLRNDKIALVVFAGNAFLQVPISADNVSIAMFLDAINTGMIPTQGTSITEALSVSNRSFTNQRGVKRAIVLITDGEDHEGGVDEVVSELAKNDVNVFVLGIGDSKGAPLKIGGDYLRSIDGQVVISRLNEQMCKEIANKTKGDYIHVDNSNSGQEQLLTELGKLQTSDLETATYSEYNELFPWLVAIALILLALEVFVTYRKSQFMYKWRNGTNTHIYNVLIVVIAVMLFGNFQSTMAQTATKIHTHKGNVAFNQKLDSLAIIYFKKAIALDSTNFKAHFNLANTYLRQGKAQDAMREYEKSASLAPTKLIKKAIFHNMGTIYYVSAQYENAINSYKESLRTDPKDNRVRYNLAMAQYMLKKNPQQKSQKPDSKQNESDKNNQKKQEQQKNNSQNNNSQSKDNMSKQNTEQMLRAVQMKERQTQEKLKHKQKNNSNRYLEKNW